MELVVLLVINDKDVLDIAQSTYKKAGYRWIVSEQLQDAIEILEKEAVDVLLVDAHQIKRYGSLSLELTQPKKPDFEVVILGSIEHLETLKRTLQEYADQVIFTPISRDDLLLCTERIIRKKKARQVDIQDEKMAALGRMIASIAHKINNPLQSIQNCMHMIQYGHLSEEALSNYISLVNEEVNNLADTVNMMLDLYRQGELVPKLVNINKLVNHVISEIDAHINLAGVTAEIHLGEGNLWTFVIEHQIEKVISSLVQNAIEAMPDGGVLYIQTEQIDRQVIIIIEDTGPGIPDSDKEKTFEPFWSTKAGGKGLGLSISYGIVSAHGGSLELVSSKGKGSRFRVSLPVGKVL